MNCWSMPNFLPATSVVQDGGFPACCAATMIWFSVSTIARRRRTATESRASGSP